MGAGRVHRSCAVSAAACCVLCLLCHHSTPCSAQSGLSTQSDVQADATWPGNDLIIELILKKYGDGKTIDSKRFQMLLDDLQLTDLSKLGDRQKLVSTHNHSEKDDEHSNAQVCESINYAIHQPAVNANEFQQVCPALIMKLVTPVDCLRPKPEPKDVQETTNQGAVWLYATGSIVVISACGLLAVAVIPIMQKMFYQQMLQFLVSLAVGSLCGDALLHLLPHAMSGGHGDHHEGDHGSNINLWRGLVALMGIVFFFFTEKFLTLAGEWRRRRERKKKQQPPAKVRVMRDAELQGSSTVGEKLCKHKYSSYPYCYAEITGAEDGEKKIAPPVSPISPVGDPNAESQPTVVTTEPTEDVPINIERKPDEEAVAPGSDGYTVILREHAREHHGHSHSHGHVHSAPHSLSAVAWMVVMGDGLHNFTDGLAIGTAFAAGIPGGLSTAIAVFCHELPHELGDFAVLLKAGMSAKQAVCYNMLSSVLCFLGMVLGVSLGHSESAAQWVFAVAGGMFLYIALVDMIPELTSGHSEDASSSAWIQTMLLQLVGMFTGLGIMLVIAFYEDSLHNLFCD